MSLSRWVLPVQVGAEGQGGPQHTFGTFKLGAGNP